MDWLKGITVTILIILFSQDIKQRQISVYTITLLGIIYAIRSFPKGNTNAFLLVVLTNFLFLLVQYCSIVLFTFFKTKKIDLLQKENIGLGDVIFVLILTFIFKPKYFILFIIVSSGLSLIIHFFTRLFHKEKYNNIPLVGYFSIILILYEVLPVLKPHFLFN